MTDFLLQIIPTTVFDAFARGNILSVVLVSVLFGLALSKMGEKAKPILGLIDSLTQAVFSVVSILMLFAPIGAFGAMAFTIGRYGLGSLGPLAKLILTFWATCILFVLVVLGTIARLCGFQHHSVSALHKRRSNPCVVAELIGARSSNVDGESWSDSAARRRWSDW